MPTEYPSFLTNTELDASFNDVVRDTHLIYDYDAENSATREKEKWRYEMWFQHEDRIVYKIHGGPMAGRVNYQTCTYQCIRPGEIYQCNWLEETGTICSLVWDVKEKTVTTLLGFSKGHWEYPEQAHGSKHNRDDFARWRKLADIGKQTDRFMLSEQAHIVEQFKGPGELQPVSPDAVTF